MDVPENYENKRIAFVGIGEIVSGDEEDILKISSLGSCIGVVLFPKNTDYSSKVAVMGHIMLPYSPKKGEKKIPNRWGPAKYAEKAVPTMILMMQELGIKVDNIGAKIVGGANMFGHGSKTLQIGKTNEKVTKKLLLDHKIQIKRSFTGGDIGMSVTYVVKDNLLTVQPTGGAPIIL
ncbi:MAG: chemotaxis protein CheD [Candidatus Heimdallarchaeota archaeon]|nr:chemotaxis protein CheD [Candidatus Heimdallarchaeota archaeon]